MAGITPGSPLSQPLRGMMPAPPQNPPSPLPTTVQPPQQRPPAIRRAVLHQVAPTDTNPTICSVLIENRFPPRPGFTLPMGQGTIYKAGSTITYNTQSDTVVAPGTVTITPLSMGNGILGQIALGDSLVLDSGLNAETVTVTAVTGTTFTCVCTKSHSGTYTIAATVAAPGPFYNDPSTNSGGSYVLVDTVNMCVVQILQGVSSVYPSPAAALIATHVHTGTVDANGNPMPQPVDLQNHTQNTISTGQLPSNVPPQPVVERLYIPGDTNPKAATVTSYEVSSKKLLNDYGVSCWVNNVPNDKLINRIGWAVRLSSGSQMVGKWWAGAPPVGGGDLPTTPDATSLDSIIEYDDPADPSPPSSPKPSPLGDVLFYARFVGSFIDPITGNGTLGCYANDGCRVTVDGTVLFDNLGSGDAGSYEHAAFNFVEGTEHEIIIEWANTNIGGPPAYKLLLGYTPTAVVTSPIYGLAVGAPIVGNWSISMETAIPGLPNPAAEQQLTGGAYSQLLNGTAYDFGVCYVTTGGVAGPVAVFASDYTATGGIDGLLPGLNGIPDSGWTTSKFTTNPSWGIQTAGDPNVSSADGSAASLYWTYNLLDNISVFIAAPGTGTNTDPSVTLNSFIAGFGQSNITLGHIWAKSSAINVVPGETYILSTLASNQRLSGTGLDGKGMYAAIVSDDGDDGFPTSIYEYATIGSTVQQYATAPWTCPVGVTSVRVLADFNGMHLGTGSPNPFFSQMMFEVGSTPTAYTDGPLVTTSGQTRSVQSVTKKVTLGTSTSSPSIEPTTVAPVSGTTAPPADQLPQGSVKLYASGSGQAGLYQQLSSNPLSPDWQMVGSAVSLSNLSDVSTTGLVDNQILVWNATSSKWVNTDQQTIRKNLISDSDFDFVDYSGSTYNAAYFTPNTFDSHFYFVKTSPSQGGSNALAIDSTLLGVTRYCDSETIDLVDGGIYTLSCEFDMTNQQ